MRKFSIFISLDLKDNQLVFSVCTKAVKPSHTRTSATKSYRTLKVVAFPVLKDVVDDNDREDHSPEMNLRKYQMETHGLKQHKNFFLNDCQFD
jgi:hypothetical protein